MQELEALIEEELARFQIPGTAVAVVKEGEVVVSKGFGSRDAEQRLPTTEQTLFPIGSTTKAFTAAVIGTLVDEGVLEWDRPVGEYLPGFKLHDPVATEQLTLRDMLSHQSGLPRHDRLMLMYGGGGLSRAELVERLRYLEPNKGFRAAWQYNNLIYMTAGYIVEVVSGQTWEEAVQHRLLDPLGMTNTNFFMADLQKSDDHSLGYTLRDGEVTQVPYRTIEIIGPAGSINSCIDDMSRWLLLNSASGDSKVLSPQALKELRSPAIVMPGDAIPWSEVNLVGYALGWVIEDFRGHRHVWHNGGIDGFKTFISFVPEQNAGVVVLSNSFPSYGPEVICYRVLEELLELDPLPWGDRYLQVQEATAEGARETRAHRRARAKDAPPTHPLGDFAGVYSHPGYGRISFAVDDGELVPDLHDLRVTMQHRHYNVWDAHEKMLDETTPFVFSIDADGEIAAVAARLEPTVEPIIFEKDPDPALSDPDFLARLVGTFSFDPYELTVEVKGSTLQASGPVLGAFELIPRLGLRFDAKGHQDVRFEFVLEGEAAQQLVVEPIGVFTRRP